MLCKERGIHPVGDSEMQRCLKGCGQEFIFISVPFSDATERNRSVCQGMWLPQSSWGFVSTESQCACLGCSSVCVHYHACPACLGDPEHPRALTMTPPVAVGEPWEAALEDRDHLAQALRGRGQLLEADSSPVAECPCPWHLPKAAELQTSCRSKVSSPAHPSSPCLPVQVRQ